MAFFIAEDTLLNIFLAKANSSTSYSPVNADGERIPYRYVIMTTEGFWAKNSISEAEGTEAKLLPNKFKPNKINKVGAKKTEG